MSFTAFVLNPYEKTNKGVEEDALQSEAQHQEIMELAKAISLDVIYDQLIALRKISPATYIGKGIIADIKELALAENPDVIIVNASLTPIQQRNLEKQWDAKVIDRVGLILEIFGARAQTKEGKLQVELASLEYQKSRLVRSWTHLERQRGGTGATGGPGETQIEIDRRLIGERITQIKKEIEQVKKNRALQKRSREQVPYPIVALVGYTNAGKSTLFNGLTGANIMAKDMLFATLDTTMRRTELPSGQEIILSDTVGFISDLPTHLITAFRATLEQVSYADVILHVQDVSSPNHKAQKAEVERILKDFDIEPDADHIINVYNKIDLMPDKDRKAVLKFELPSEAYISAEKRYGLDKLLIKIEDYLQSEYEEIDLKLSHKDGKAINWLHEHADILSHEVDDKHVYIKALIHPRDLGKYRQLF